MNISEFEKPASEKLAKINEALDNHTVLKKCMTLLTSKNCMMQRKILKLS